MAIPQGLPAFSRRDVAVTIYDSGETHTMTVGPGDFLVSFPGIQAGDTGVNEVKSRGFHVGLVIGDQEPVEFSFNVTSGVADDITNAAVRERILDAVRKTGDWADAVSMETVGCGVWCAGLRFVFSNSCGKSATIEFAKVRMSADVELTESGMTATINCIAYGDGEGGSSYTIT